MFWSYVGILCYTLNKVSRCTPQGSHRGLFWTTFALFPVSIRFMCLTKKHGALINAKVAHYLSMMGIYLDLTLLLYTPACKGKIAAYSILTYKRQENDYASSECLPLHAYYTYCLCLMSNVNVMYNKFLGPACHYSKSENKNGWGLVGGWGFP